MNNYQVPDQMYILCGPDCANFIVSMCYVGLLAVFVLVCAVIFHEARIDS